MSYILDAISKAEKQRQHERVPTLESAVSNHHATGKNVKVGRTLGICIIGILLVALGWYVKPVTEQVVVVYASVSAWVESKLESEDEPKELNPQPAVEQTEPENQVESDVIPESIRQQLDKLSFSVVSYSKDANKRFVMDGSKVLREGDAINGYTIKAIEKSSIVLDVENLDYRINY